MLSHNWQAVVIFSVALYSLVYAAPTQNPTGPYPLAVRLPYGTYAGYYNSSADLNIWLGIRYAAAPIGQNRWKAAQPPAKNFTATIQANALPNQCPQATSANQEAGDDEDCLFLNVYSPNNAKNLPVLVWIHGGSWDHNGAKEFDLTPMINLSGNQFIGVVIQYRLGVFGFLAGNDGIRQSGGLNAAITDARFALEWVQSNIGLFGGNKDHVTIYGQSSGAGSVLQLIVQEARSEGPPLFKASAVSSPWMPPTGSCDGQFFVDQFHNFSTVAGCPDDLNCLRAANTSVLKAQNFALDHAIPASHRVNYWTACIEGTGKGAYVQVNPTNALLKGEVAGDYLLSGNNAADGGGTTPANLSTDALWTNFLNSNWPLTQSQLDKINSTLYPASAFPTSHERGYILYQDVVFSCHATWLAEAFKKKGGAWRYLFAIPPALHAQDNAYEFPYWYWTKSPVSDSFFASYTGAIASFIRAWNPNTAKPKAGDSLYWPSFQNGAKEKVFNLTATNELSVYFQDAYTLLSGTKERCDFWGQVRSQGNW